MAAVSHVDENGVLWVIPEPSGRCELCGAIEETRPYGPGGCQVCFSCGMKDEQETKRQFDSMFVRDVIL